MRRAAIFLLCTAGVLFGAYAPHAHAAVSDWQRGANIESRYAGDFTSDALRQSLQNLKDTGANSVTLVLQFMQDSQNSSSVYPRDTMPSSAALGSVIDYAHSLGLSVILAPHVDAWSGVWRADINPADRNAWFASYVSQLTPIAQTAQAHGAEALVVGTELITLSANDQYADNTPHWRNLIAQLRGIYSGKLSYSANWGGPGWTDEKNRIAFWDALDYAGIDAYHNLGGEYYNNSVDSLKQYWAGQDANDIQPFWQRIGKPIVFGEIGYKSTTGAHTQPWNSGHYDGVNLTEQANDYSALFSYWADSPELSGVQLWDWSSDPNAGGSGDAGYTPQHKPAQDVMKTWWQPPQASTFTASATTAGTTVGSPIAITATVTDTGGATSGIVVDIETYNSSNQKIFQKFYENESFAAGQQKQYTAQWTPAAAGTYRIMVGVFSSGWDTNYVWNNNATQVQAGTGGTPPGGGGNPAFNASATAPSSASVGSPVSIIAHITDTGGAGSALVDIEVYDQNNSKVHQAVFDNQTFAAGQARDFQTSWTPSATGSYTVKIGVFSSGWAQLYTWVNNAGAISVGSGGGGGGGSPPPPPPPPSPPSGTATISPASQTVSPGQSIDFSGHGFGHEETVTITRSGTQIGAVHADGGGNFSTGSMAMPVQAGTYNFVFTGHTSGLSASSTITVQ